MNTPICDFVRSYEESRTLRMHMPGHKGQRLLGPEPLDITEIQGADSLYEADGIIRQSEENAGQLFGCPTFYSTEGSSQCIRAMLYLVLLRAKQQGRKPLIAAGRNAHKTFLSAAALLELDVVWLTGEWQDSYLSCDLTAEGLSRQLSAMDSLPAAVYVTSPDYLGNMPDIAALASVCRRFGILLLVDNAHGAYLRFLPRSQHPMDLGADMCCASAHKTLPGLTGSAYLHIAKDGPALFLEQARNALALFGSTSPSYLILQSLDLLNRWLGDSYAQRLAAFLPLAEGCKARLRSHSYDLPDNEPLKLTLSPRSRGYRGTELAAFLRQKNIECEFADPDFVVLMLTPDMDSTDLQAIEAALLELPPREPLSEKPPRFSLPRQVCSIREAVLSPCETIPASQSLGRIQAAVNVGCPPAVPIVVSGECIDAAALECFAYYGIETCTVISGPTAP